MLSLKPPLGDCSIDDRSVSQANGLKTNTLNRTAQRTSRDVFDAAGFLERWCLVVDAIKGDEADDDVDEDDDDDEPSLDKSFELFDSIENKASDDEDEDDGEGVFRKSIGLNGGDLHAFDGTVGVVVETGGGIVLKTFSITFIC